VHQQPEPVVAENRRPGVGSPPWRAAGGRVRIDRVATSVLIVDDHARFRETARRALERDGWQVVGEAADGESALRAAQTLEPDVVLLDVGLPDMSGLEVARHLRDRSPRLAVVVVSTRDSSDYRDLALANGARGFLAKADLTGAALAALL
jgi:two-component system response regulator EvgA